MFELGIEVRDKITGFTGILTGHCQYITGCDQFLVQPKAKDGAHVEGRWIDDIRLEVMNTTPVTLEYEEPRLTGQRTGGESFADPKDPEAPPVK